MYYKLTNRKLQTYGGFQWQLNKWVKVDGKGELCSKHWLHCYNHPLLAVLLNPIHAAIEGPHLFRVNVRGKKLSDAGLKFGFTKMQLVKALPLPNISLNQKIAFGILCVKKINSDKNWNKWADNWLSGKNRTKDAADAARADVAYATDITAYAAYTAARAAAYAVAAIAAADVASAAAIAVITYNNTVFNNIDLIKIAKEAMKYE